MAEEKAAPLEDTPPEPAVEPAQPDSQEGTPGEQQTVDWQKRYQDLQSEFTPTRQELAQYQQVVAALNSDDPQDRQAAAEALGLEFAEEEEPEAEEPGADPRLEQMWDHFQQTEAQQAQAHQEEQVAYAVGEQLTEQLQAQGREFSDPEDPEAQFLFNHAYNLVMEGQDPGLAAQEAIGLAGRFREMTASEKKQAWADSKRTSVPALGQEAVEQPNLDKRSDRVAWMTAQLEANEQQ